MLNVDLLTCLIAILLPWSTTGVAIVAALWVVAVGFTVEMRPFVRSLARPVSILPVAFFALAVAGTLWSDAPWWERLHSVNQVSRLLFLPLLFYHFERSQRGRWVFAGFLASCLLLMLVSWVAYFDPDLSAKKYLSYGAYVPVNGVFVRNYIDQSQEFTLCALALAYPFLALWRANSIRAALLLAAIASSFVINMIFVVVSRTALVTMPILLAVFALLHLRWRTAVAAFLALLLIAALSWGVSASLRATVAKFFNDYQQSEVQLNESGMGSRLEYWKKSLGFFAQAPLIGHGTGSTRGLFQRAAIGQTGLHAEVVGDPHNQTLNVAVQWGVVGIVVLYATWLVHLSLFRGEGFAAWIGLLVVVQNICTSLFNSHLFDFNEGWIYVLGVGICGGMTLAARVSADRSTLPGPASG